MGKATFLVTAEFRETRAAVELRVRATVESEAVEKAMETLVLWPWVRELGLLSFRIRRVLCSWPAGRPA